MPIPRLDHRGLLPEGVHICSFDEVTAQFCIGQYRQVLWSDFLRWLSNEIHPKGLLLPLYIAGSFFSDKTNPGDIEVAIDLHGASDQQSGLALLLFATEHKRYETEYRVDYYPNMPGNNNFGAFFQYVGPKTAQAKNLDPNDKRGIVRVEQWTLG